MDYQLFAHQAEIMHAVIQGLLLIVILPAMAYVLVALFTNKGKGL